jgi:diguanylate cyclase (GGDEF)-like protein
MNKDVEILAKRKYNKATSRIHDETDTKISNAKSEIMARHGSMRDGASIAKMFFVARTRIKSLAHAKYESYKEAFADAGYELTEPILRECGALGLQHYKNALPSIVQFVEHQCAGTKQTLDQMMRGFEGEIERDKHDFENDIEIDCAKARVKRGAGLNDPTPLRDLKGKPVLEAYLERALEGPSPVAAIAIDLDGFKALNDRKGHSAGDSCLDSVAQLIGLAILGKGTLYRPGGDEFVAVLHNACTEEAIPTAERIRKAIENANLGGDVPVTCSIGVASSSEQNLAAADSLLKAADEAMYGAKYTTKNRVVVWPIEQSIQDAINKARSK